VDIYIASRDWQEPPLGSGLYPDDLPIEWQLGYYANEFNALLLPVERWAGLDAALAGRWLEDVPAGFRFFLELQAGAEPERAALLGPGLGGFVVPEGAASWSGRWAELAPVASLAGEKTLPDGAPGGLAQVGVHAGDGPALLRRRLEAVLASGADTGLVWCGDEQPWESLRRVQVIADLLGV
jgi:hypothetical protein